MRIYLLLNGEYVAPKKKSHQKEYVIAVDGGMRHADKMGVMPNLWLGDFDSSTDELSSNYQSIEKIIYPVEKDATDFELALQYIEKAFSPDRVDIVGAGGGEADHNFANLWVLAKYSFFSCAWVNGGNWLYLPAGKRLHLTGEKGSLISLFALTKLENIVSVGLKWEFNHHQLLPFSALASRNRLEKQEATIGWEKGNGLIFINKNIDFKLE